MTRKLATLLIAILFTFTAINSASAAPLFTDVSDKHSSKPELDYLAEHGIIDANPNEPFRVKENITRLDASVMIIKALGLEIENRPAPNLIDISPEDEYYAYIATITDEKIMVGNGNKEFMPDDKLTRAHMAVILTRAFELKGTTTYTFRDVYESHWTSDFIKTLFVNGVTNGYADNTFKPDSFLSRVHFSVFLARILNPEFQQTIACYQPNNKKSHAVNVSVTNIWNQPNKTRSIDAPSLTKPADMAKWTKSLSTSQKQWLVGKTDTQALFGDEVSILKTSGNWVQIAVKDQSKTNQPKGYVGWVPKSHITTFYPNYTNCKIAVVQAKIATLYNEPKTTTKFMDVSFTTILPVIKEEAGWIYVQTPANGVKYLRSQDAKTHKDMAAIPKPTQNDIVNGAKRFLGLPYLWAGTSAYGFDCSGLMYAVYKSHGVIIPRDSFVQAKHGTPVTRNNMQPGDLLFFAYHGGQGKVYHVGMYIGNGQMIHAPNSLKKVEIASINSQPYKKNYSGSRRYLK